MHLTRAENDQPRRHSSALLWLLVLAYVPFMMAHGVEAWSRPSVDFPPLYSASKAVFAEQRSPYGDDAFERQAVALGRWVPPFIYPPPSLLLLYPLHWFSYDTAKAAMLVVNHLCLLGAMLFLLRRLFREEFDRPGGHFAAALVIVYILLFDPAAVTMQLGQVNLLLLVCLCLAWNGLKRGASDWAVALPLSLAIIIKTYPVLLLPLLVFRRRYKAAALTLACFAAACAASYFLLPHGIWSDWLEKVVPRNSETHAGPWNQNIRAFVARAFLPNPFSDPLVELPGMVRPLIVALSVAVVGATLWSAWRASRRTVDARAIDYEMSLFLFMIFLIAPVSWEHHFVYLLPSLVLVLVLVLEERVNQRWRWIAAVSLLVIAWKIPIAAPELTKGFATLAISAKFYPAVALWLFFLLQTRAVAARPLNVGR